jgi:hypothetical protein
MPRGVRLTTHPHIVPRSWMSRSYTSSPSAPPWCVVWLLYLWIGGHIKINITETVREDGSNSCRLGTSDFIAVMKLWLPQHSWSTKYASAGEELHVPFTLCCSYWWGKNTSLNFGHQQAYCSSPRWPIRMENHGKMISRGKDSWFIHHRSLLIQPPQSSSSESEGIWGRKCWILPTNHLFHTRRVL